ncbi:hypothetical protein SNE40_013661 [Patella caerulea]|uniref:Uncharacterized protein n=1 Tax=Patella caerulea TaxID=87958 RepID=A0AAN8PFS5_PATCE
MGIMIRLSFVAAIIMLHIDAVSMSPVVSFCSDRLVSGRVVYLSGIDNNTNGIGCNCSLSLITYNQDPVKLEIKNVTTSNVCDYSLYSVYRNNTIKLYSCDEHVQLHKKSFDFSPMETVRLHMETGTYNAVGFPFCLQLLTGVGSQIKLECRSKTTTTASSAYTVSTRAENSMTTIYDNKNIPVSRTGDTRYMTFISNISNVTPSTSPKPQPNNDDSDDMIGIIVGSIVGVLIVVALVIIIVCLMKRRKKDIIYETPQQPQQSSHIYMDLHGVHIKSGPQQNNEYMNVGKEGVI